MSLTQLGEAIDFDRNFAKEILKEREIGILVQINEGEAIATAWGCDLSYEYVRINGSLQRDQVPAGATPTAITDNLALA